MQNTAQAVERFEDENERDDTLPLSAGVQDDALQHDAAAATFSDSLPTAPQHYIASLLLLAFLVLGAIAVSNRLLMPWMHMPTHKEQIAHTLLSGENMGLFDLNIDIRAIRKAQFAALKKTPEVMLLGASQWQEASADLLPQHDLFNAHIHRDYYDDVVATVGLLIEYNVLPRTLIISVRDSTFTSVGSRTDALWMAFLKEYQVAEKQLGVTPRPWWENIQPKVYWDLFSLSTASDMARRWLRAPETPGPTTASKSETLDILMSDGSIRWAKEHDRLFTQERSQQLSIAMAEAAKNREPEIDPHAVAAFSTALRHLKERGVEVVLVHPPFNPIFYNWILGTKYDRGLDKVIAVTEQLAEKYGFKTAGSMNPYKMGCTEQMFIDAEHSGPPCVQKVLQQIATQFVR